MSLSTNSQFVNSRKGASSGQTYKFSEPELVNATSSGLIASNSPVVVTSLPTSTSHFRTPSFPAMPYSSTSSISYSPKKNSGYVPSNSRTASYIPGSPKSSVYVPSSPRASTYVHSSPRGTTYVPSSPRASTYVPSSPRASTYVPSSPRASTYVPSSPRSSVYAPSSPRSFSYVPTFPSSNAIPELVTDIIPSTPSYVPSFPSSNAIPELVTDIVPSTPSYVPSFPNSNAIPELVTGIVPNTQPFSRSYVPSFPSSNAIPELVDDITPSVPRSTGYVPSFPTSNAIPQLIDDIVPGASMNQAYVPNTAIYIPNSPSPKYAPSMRNNQSLPNSPKYNSSVYTPPHKSPSYVSPSLSASQRTAYTGPRSPSYVPPITSPFTTSTSRRTSNLNKSSLLFPNLEHRTSLDTLRIDTAQGTVGNEGIEKELMMDGYVPLAKLVVKEGENKNGYFIKAINKLGQYVYISLDTEGFIATNPKDLTMVKSDIANTIPYSVKMSALECAGLNVCGLAFECENGLCSLSTDVKTNKPVEESFIYTEDRSERTGLISSGLISYPIIKMSEIRADRDLVLKLTNESINRIRNSSYINVENKCVATKNSLLNLVGSFDNFINTKDVLFNKLRDSLEILGKISRDFHLKPPTTDEARKRYNTLLYNLRRRNDLFVTLLETINHISEESSHFNKCTSDINEITLSLKQNFEGVDSIYPDPSSNTKY
jgi:hypothetical protein